MVQLVKQLASDPKFVGSNVVTAGTMGHVVAKLLKALRYLFILGLKCHGKLPWYLKFGANKHGYYYKALKTVVKRFIVQSNICFKILGEFP